MMNLKYTIIGVIFSISFLSCKKTGLKTYSGKDLIYFNDMTTRYPVERKDSVVLNFEGKRAATKDTLFNLPVSIMGKPSEKDRYFKIQVDQDKTTAKAGQHYDAFPDRFVIRSGAVGGFLPIRIYRDASLSTASYKLSIELIPSDDFVVNISPIVIGSKVISQNHYKILIADFLTKPDWWIDVESYFGSFSRKKMNVLTEVSGFTSDQIGNYVLAYDRKTIDVISKALRIHLNYQLFIGKPVIDDNGENMSMQ